MQLILIRHTSVDVPRGICYGQTDVPLASSFPEEAAVVSDTLKSFRFDAVYTSPLSRCVKLAEFCGFPDAIHEPRIMEMNFGEWEMKKYDEIKDARLQEWFEDYMNVTPTNGESAMDQRARFMNFIKDLRTQFSDSASVAVFTHGGILIHALNAFMGEGYEKLFRSLPPYGSVIELNI